MLPCPEFLAIGHVTLDLREDRSMPGGAAFFAAVAAARLGRGVGLLTAGMPPKAQKCLGTLIQVINIPSTTTTFQNTYTPQGRAQQLHSLGRPIQQAHLPAEWKGSQVVLLAPVASEVDHFFTSLFPASLVGVSPQVWMRRWDSRGRIERAAWNGEGVIDKAQVVILSVADLPSLTITQDWLRRPTILILTQAKRGALLHWQQQWFKIPPYQVAEVDPTGAGDVFAASFLIRYNETGDPFVSALFASCAASLAVKSEVAESIPTRDQVEKRMKKSAKHRVLPCANQPPGFLQL